MKPSVVCQHSATSRLGQFLDRLLRPVIEHSIQSITFVHGADFIRKLTYFTENKQRFRSTTILTKITISNYYS